MSQDAQRYEYSEVADRQLDALWAEADAEVYNSIVDVCERILETPGQMRAISSAIRTESGMRFRTPVPGAFPYKVFWSHAEGKARIEAIFPHSA